MIIENEIKTRKIEFTKIESVKEHYPSHRIQIDISTENIKANFNRNIWLSDADIEKFLVELDALNESRNGEATLGGMSPGEMTLIIKPIDNLGHLTVSLRFVHEDRVDFDYSWDVKVEFQIDPTSLVSVRNGLLRLME